MLNALRGSSASRGKYKGAHQPFNLKLKKHCAWKLPWIESRDLRQRSLEFCFSSSTRLAIRDSRTTLALLRIKLITAWRYLNLCDYSAHVFFPNFVIQSSKLSQLVDLIVFSNSTISSPSVYPQAKFPCVTDGSSLVWPSRMRLENRPRLWRLSRERAKRTGKSERTLQREAFRIYPHPV